MFERTFIAGWADMDFNSHMRNTAFLDRCSDIRMMYFTEYGFPVEEFARRSMGPVVMTDDVRYHREVHLLQEFRVTLAAAGFAEDGSRFLLRDEIWRSDGKLAASITSAGGWLDLGRRKLVAPPADLLAAINELQKTDDFEVLPSSIR